MPIWIDLANLLITKEAIAAKYAGGIDRFRSDLGFDTVEHADQEDGQLFCIGAMEVDALWSRLVRLRDVGLRYSEEDPERNDMVLIARYGGPVNVPHWLRFNGIYAWHVDCPAEKQEFVRSIVKLDVGEFLARQERGEIPVGTVV
jgi:hypothetical protein